MSERGTVRPATTEELPGIMNVLDGSMLAVGATTVRGRIRDDEVLVYVEGGEVLGALVLDGSHVEAVAVRRARRDQDIGTRLVGAALERTGRLTADFREEIRPFYEALGFEVEECGRLLRGVLTAER